MFKKLLPVMLAAFLAACGYVDTYEEGVYDYEPSYCYKTIGGVACYREPDHRDERRLVNYYGPHPSRYDVPEPQPAPNLKAPPSVDRFVRDPDVIPAPVASRQPTVGQPVSGELKTTSALVLRPLVPQNLTFTYKPEPIPAPVAEVSATALDGAIDYDAQSLY